MIIYAWCAKDLTACHMVIAKSSVSHDESDLFPFGRDAPAHCTYPKRRIIKTRQATDGELCAPGCCCTRVPFSFYIRLRGQIRYRVIPNMCPINSSISQPHP